MTAVEELIALVRARKRTLGFAESCTGGLLSSTLTALPGVSDVYLGAVISYSNDLKIKFLGVQAGTLKNYGAVSEETAREMVRGAAKALNVDYALSVTGIAGPTGGSPGKPVGTVFVAVLGPKFEVIQKYNFSGGRVEIQQQTVQRAIELLLKQVLNESH